MIGITAPGFLNSTVKETMDPFPLIPKSNVKPCSDISHVIQEEFQDILKEEVLELHIVENQEHSCSGDMEIKKNITAMKETFKEHEILMEDIIQIEEKLMDTHADLLIQKEIIQNNEVIQERLTLRTKPCLQEFSKEMVQKYNIIQTEDLLPPVYERVLGK